MKNLKYTNHLKTLPMGIRCTILAMGLCVALLARPMLATAQPATETTVIDKVIAKVDDYIVLESQLQNMYLSYLQQGANLGPNGKCTLLEQLIVQKVLVAKAEIDSVEVTDGEVELALEQRIAFVLQQVGGNEADVVRYYGKPLESIREDLRPEIREQMLAERMQQQITTDIAVTPKEVERFFKNIPNDSLPFYSTEVVVGHIVKKPTVNKAQKDQVVAQLNQYRRQVENGLATFEDLARRYSQDPGSGSRGGDLGWTSRGQLVPEFEAAAMRLKPNQISSPIESDFGFHLIQLLERRGQEYHARHILIKPNSSQADVEQASHFLDSVRTLVLADSITWEYAAKEHSEDQNTNTTGGYFTDPSGSISFNVEQIDPELFFVIDSMTVGNITKPLEVTMPDGSKAVRLVYFKERKPPHQANLEQDYEKIKSSVLAVKKNNRLQEWFDKAKTEVFIDIDDDYKDCRSSILY